MSQIPVHITFCMGVAKYPSEDGTAQELIKHANTALQLAKNKGKNQVLQYENFMGEELSKQHILLEALQSSIENENFIPLFQPKIDLSTHKILSFEALVRWESNSKMIPPNIFLGIATENNLINDIDFIMLKKSLLQLEQWHKNGYEVSVSVNFTNGDFTSVRVYEELQKYEKYLPYLFIEITENELMTFTKEEMDAIEEFKNLGIKISLDDFGTGYSSLQYIHVLPLDEIKIDKAFVDKIPGQKKDEDLIKIIKNIAQTFNLHCIVEGVETQEQIDFFKNLHLFTIQGYFFSKPLLATEADNLLKEYNG